jgi:AcrR family transcriptional regulator
MPKGIPLTEEERQRTRRSVYQVAMKLFLKQGFHETSMRAVAEAAGMGKSTLYDYFPRKEEILLYFIEREMEVTHREARDIAAQQLSADEKLRRILHSLWSYLNENRAFAALTAREAGRLGPRAVQRMARRRMAYRGILEQVIREGIAEGDFRAVDPALAASALHSMMTQPFYDWLSRGEPGKAKANADSLVDLFLDGIRRT